MKNAIWALPAVLFTFAAAQTQPAPQRRQQAPAAQQQAQPAPAQQRAQPPAYGRGRGGLPSAWNDRNKDGLCDMTGRPVGQGRATGGGRWGDRHGNGICDFTGRPAGAGRGAAVRGGGWGRGGGRGFAAAGRGRGGWWRSGCGTTPAPVQPPASTAPATPKQ